MLLEVLQVDAQPEVLQEAERCCWSRVGAAAVWI